MREGCATEALVHWYVAPAMLIHIEAQVFPRHNSFHGVRRFEHAQQSCCVVAKTFPCVSELLRTTR